MHVCVAIIVLLLTTVPSSAQTGYNIKVTIDGWRDTTVYLGYYDGESTFVKDTARANGNGEFTFAGQGPLPEGVYFLAQGAPRPAKIFELIVGQSQSFSLRTDTSGYIAHMKVSGDPDNKLFFDNMIFNMERNKEVEPFLKIMQDSSLSADKKKEAAEGLRKVNENVISYQNDIIQRYPRSVTARLLKAYRPLQIPEPPRRNDGTIDSSFQLKWYRAHYFDNFDLADDLLIRMSKPLYKEKMNEYLDRLWPPQADSLIKALSGIISRAKANKETYKYAVLKSVLKFQSPEIMGLDKVFVYINDTYFATGEMDYWANEQMRKNVKDHADRLRKSLIGQKGANLIMQDVDLKPRALYDINDAYTVLYIFDPDCGACKKETPKLVDFYNKTKFDVEVYAVSADTSMAKMRDYIAEMNLKWITVNGPRTYVGPYQDLYDASTTPTLYVMDRQKKIIAKKIPAEKIEEFLGHHQRMNSE